MISDFVKGKKKFDYSPGIQQGIELHRIIDTFTDEHAVTKEAKEIFRPHYRLYAGAFVDVVYDHFLATDKTIFTDETLKRFADETYTLLNPYLTVFPEKFTRMFPYMKEQNWLYHYSTLWGIEKSLHGVVRRATYLTESATAFSLMQQHYTELKQLYAVFFPEIHTLIKDWFLNKEILPFTD